MAIATRTLKDTKIATGSGAAGGKVTVLINMNDNTTAVLLMIIQVGLLFILKAILMLQQLI